MECSLLRTSRLGLVQAIWPEERAVVGMRVCKLLHRELAICKVLLVRRLGNETAGSSTKDQLRDDFCRLRGSTISLHWHGRSCDALLGAIWHSGTAAVLTELVMRSNHSIRREHILRDKTDDEEGVRTEIAEEGWQTDVEGETLVGVVQGCTSLTRLELPANSIGDTGARELGAVLGSCKLLTSLNISENGIGEGESVAALLEHCPSLTHLNLSSNHLDAAAVSLTKVLGTITALSHLSMSANGIDNAEARRLGEALGACRALAYLDLQRNKMRCDGAGWLARALVQCTTLTHLNVSFNGIGGHGAHSIARSCSQLRHLDLSRNDLGDRGAQLLSEGLQACGSIAHLNLARTRMHAEAMRHLSHALLPLASAELRFLSVAWNKLGPDGAALLAEGVVACRALTHLDVSNCAIGQAGAECLARAAQQCPGLTAGTGTFKWLEA